MSEDPNFRGAPHLSPSMQPYLAIEGHARLHACWNEIFVSTSATKEAFDALTQCFNAPNSTKPRGLVLMGQSDTGKSRTMAAFRSMHPINPDVTGEVAEVPVIYLKAPDKPSRTLIYKSLLAEIGKPIPFNYKEEDLRWHTLELVRKSKVRLIMIDELHDISRQQMSAQLVEFLRFLKNLINAIERPFVVGGVSLVVDVLNAEEQTMSRFDTVIKMEPFALAEFVKALRIFERLIPLRRPSKLSTDADVVGLLFEATQGYIGRLSNLLHDACLVAIDTGEERITYEVLMKVPDRSIRNFNKRGKGR